MMKKSSFGRIIALALTLAVILGAVTIDTGVAQAATAEEVVRIYVESYNDSVKIRDGEKVTESLIQRLGVILKGQTESGRVVPLPIQVKEKGSYIHAVNGKATFTFYYGTVTKKLSVPVRVKAKKLTVTVKKNATLPEAQKLTMSMAISVVKATVAYKDGKKVKNFKGLSCKQVGRTIKPNSKGNIKLTYYIGGARKTVSVEVNRIKRVFIGKTSYSEEFEGDPISIETFRRDNEVKAAYKKGGNLKLSTYSISISGDVVTVKYSRFTDTLKFKRVPKPAPVVTDEPEPTVAPTNPSVVTVEPTAQPTLTPSEEPTEEPTEAPVPTSSVSPTEEPTIAPTTAPTAEPTVTPSEEPTEEPTKTPVPTSTVMPTEEPTIAPTTAPTAEPTVTPSEEPIAMPTEEPTAEPTVVPTEVPTEEPTATPTQVPTATPTEVPTVEPTQEPTSVPTVEPTQKPEVVNKITISEGSFWDKLLSFITFGQYEPDVTVSIESSLGAEADIYYYVDESGSEKAMSAEELEGITSWTMYTGEFQLAEQKNVVYAKIVDKNDSEVYYVCSDGLDTAPKTTPTPTAMPTEEPTAEPTATPTEVPTEAPTAEPTETPTPAPTATPVATEPPFIGPTLPPTQEPTVAPTEEPTAEPTVAPTPTATPTATPVATEPPFIGPTLPPTVEPTAEPTVAPTPTATPTATPVATEPPFIGPTLPPTAEPTETPTATPVPTSSVSPTEEPTVAPTTEPTATPVATEPPFIGPTLPPTAEPTATPTATEPPFIGPTLPPTTEPTAIPTEVPTEAPTAEPTVAPTQEPTPTPIPTSKLTLSVEGEGNLFINDEQVEAGEVPLENGSYRLRVEEKSGYEFDSIQDGEGNVLTYKTSYTFDVTEDTTIHVVFAKIYTVTLNRGIGKVTVDGADAIFQNGVATMEVREGTELTLTTSSTSEYRFARYATSTGTQLSTNASYKFTVNSNLSIVAVFERLYTFTVKREGLGGVIIGTGENAKAIKFSNNSYETHVVTGSQTLIAVENDDWHFVGWFYANSSKPFSEKLAVSVPVNVATTVVAKFAETEKTVKVQYTTDDGSVLKSESVPFGEALTPPTVNGAHGVQFVGWAIAGLETAGVETPVVYKARTESGDFYSDAGESLSEAISKLTAEKKAVTVVTVFEAEPTKYYSLAVSGASVTSFDGGEIDEEGKYSEGTHIVCDAVVPEGYSIEGWYNTITGDKVRGPYTTYDFKIQKDTSIEARFTKDAVVEPEPLLSWKNYYPDFKKKTLVLIPNAQIPKKYEIIKWGVLMTSKTEAEIPDSEFTIDNTKLLNVQAKKDVDDETGEEYYPSNHSVTISQSWSSVFDGGKTVRILIYATIDDGTGSKTIYASKPVSVNCAAGN